MSRLWQVLQNCDAMSFVAVVIFCVMGYLRGPLWLAFLGGALFGLPSVVELVLLKRRHPSVPTNSKVLSFYLGALGYSIAGLALALRWQADTVNRVSALEGTS